MFINTECFNFVLSESAEIDGFCSKNHKSEIEADDVADLPCQLNQHSNDCLDENRLNCVDAIVSIDQTFKPIEETSASQTQADSNMEGIEKSSDATQNASCVELEPVNSKNNECTVSTQQSSGKDAFISDFVTGQSILHNQH